MRLFLLPLTLVAATAAAADAPPPKPPAPPALHMTADECAVWNRERSFAAAVAAHDAKSFAEHLQADAAFLPGNAPPTRGRAAITTEWAPIIEGKELALRWYPQVVAIGGAKNVASSAGNYTIEDLRPNAKQHFLRGRFTSVWVKEADGQWRVVHDGGGMPPVAATEEDVAKIKAGFAAECPM